MKKVSLIISSVFVLFFISLSVNGNSNFNAMQTELFKSSIKIVKIKITGMTCAGCTNNVVKTLNKIDGVKKVNLEYPGDIATVEWSMIPIKQMHKY